MEIRGNVYFLGDLHGEFTWLTDQIKTGKFDCSNIIQVGDFGVGFSKEEHVHLTQLNDVCVTKLVKIFVIRGNHDDPSYFYGAFTKYSNIIFLPDNTFLELYGLNYFFSGGGISIDRCIRKVGVNYWSNEGVNFNFDKLENQMLQYSKIDVAVTHSAPNFAFPTEYDPIVRKYRLRDLKLDKDLRVERALITKLYDLLLSKKIHHWIYGHFHAHHEETTHTGVKFVALDCNEFYELVVS